jgi:predicted ATPase/class 3 adenylate cyclase
MHRRPETGDIVSDLPTGTVTYLFTDIEGSTALLQALGDAASAVFDDHDRIVGGAITDHGGTVVRTEGDSFFAAFPTGPQAVAAAVEAQRGLAAHPWPEGTPIRVRMGVHTGRGTLGGSDYRGLDVHRAARIAAAAHGGQIIISGATAGLMTGDPTMPELLDLGAHRFKDLLEPESVHQVVADGLPLDFEPIRSLDATVNNLPTQLTSFIPRPDATRIADLLQRNRLVTLTGPGGTGKTRLALHVAAEASGGFDAVYFVGLAPVTDPDLVAATIASTLGLTVASGPPEHVVADFLSGRRTLLVLDNFEQILDAATVVGHLLAGAPELKVIATSRAPLHVAGEQEYAVPPMAVPNGETDLESLQSKAAVALFVDRAASSLPDFALTEDNAAAVAEITKRLDGLPLAIELAAARVKLLPPPTLAERLRASLDVLASTRRDLPERQQTLRGAIGWSYDLLTPDEQRLLRGLSVFRGGGTLDAIERVCERALDERGHDLLSTLETLVDHSLIRQVSGAFGPRFIMLETIREFSWEHLIATDDCPLIQQAHLDTYLGLAEEAAPKLTGVEQARWLTVLSEDRDNLRAAMAHALSARRDEEAARLAAGLWRFWHMRGLIPEGREHISQVLESTDPAPALRLKVLEAAGGLAYWAGDFEATRPYYDEALAVARSLGDRPAVAAALYDVSFPSMLQGADQEMVTAYLGEAEEIYRAEGDRAAVARVTWARGVAAMFVGDPATTLDKSLEARPMLEEAGDVFMVAWSHHMTAVALLSLERHDEALSHTLAALDVFERVGDVSGIILQLQNFNQYSLRVGDHENAILFAGAVATQKHLTGMNLSEAAANAVLDLDHAYEVLGKDAADALFERGMAMSLEDAVALARAVADEKPGMGS